MLEINTTIILEQTRPTPLAMFTRLIDHRPNSTADRYELHLDVSNLAHVDFACNGVGNQGSAIFFQKFDRFFDFGFFLIDLGCFSI